MDNLPALMRAAQSGDEAAYRAVLRAAVPIAAATARRAGVRPDAIDDVVQDVLLTIHRALVTYDPAKQFQPWLRAIAQRRAIDFLRIHGRRTAREVFDEFSYENHPDPAADPTAATDRGDQAVTLRAAIAALPPQQREAIELLGLDEKSLDEASAATGRSKGALKVNLHRALRSLRVRLGSAANE